jgi:hypothetical protein
LKKFAAEIIFAAWKLEDSMENYEIRILRLDGSPALVTEQKYLNANAAVAAAKLLAGGRRFEVWNQDYCVYSGPAKADIFRPPDRPAA